MRMASVLYQFGKRNYLFDRVLTCYFLVDFSLKVLFFFVFFCFVFFFPLFEFVFFPIVVAEAVAEAANVAAGGL